MTATLDGRTVVRFTIDADAVALDWVPMAERHDALARLASVWRQVGVLVAPDSGLVEAVRSCGDASLAGQWAGCLKRFPVVRQRIDRDVRLVRPRHERALNAGECIASRADLAEAFIQARKLCGYVVPAGTAAAAISRTFFDGPLELASSVVLVDRYVASDRRSRETLVRFLRRASRLGQRKGVSVICSEVEEFGRRFLRREILKLVQGSQSRLSHVRFCYVAADSGSDSAARLYHDRWVRYMIGPNSASYVSSFGRGISLFDDDEVTWGHTIHSRLEDDSTLMAAEAALHLRGTIETIG